MRPNSMLRKMLVSLAGAALLLGNACAQEVGWQIALPGSTRKATFAYRDVLRCLGSTYVVNGTFNTANGGGQTLWQAYAVGGKDLVSTTDDFTYIVGSEYGAAYIRCVDPAGVLSWYSYYDGSPSFDEEFVAARASQDRVWAFGTTETVLNGVPRSALRLFCYDRTNGQIIYNRTYLVNGSGWSESAFAMRAFGTNIVLIGKSHPTSGQDRIVVVRVDAATGVSSAKGQLQMMSGGIGNANVKDVVIDATGKLFLGGDQILCADAAAPTIPLVYSANILADRLILSKGALLSASSEGVKKINTANGAVIWSAFGAGTFIGGFAADANGRIYVARTVDDPDWGTANGVITALDPATGSSVWAQDKIFLAANFEYSPEWLGVNAYGEIAVAARYVAEFYDPDYNEWYYDNAYEANVLYQQPEPVADTYSCVEGSTFTTNLTGVLQNDKYVNPVRCKAILVTPPANGTLTMTDDGEFTYNSVGAPIGTQTFTYRVSRGILTATAQANIMISRGLASLALARTTLAGQNATLGTVTLSSAGAAATVALSDDSSLVSVPTQVVVPASQLSANFGVSVLPVSIPVVTHITATYGGTSKSVTLTLTPLIPTAISLTPSTVVGGNMVSVRVVINGVAGAGGKVLAMSDNSTFCTMPATVTVPAGASSVTFNATTTHPATQQIVKITAAVTAGSASATLRINP